MMEEVAGDGGRGGGEVRGSGGGEVSGSGGGGEGRGGGGAAFSFPSVASAGPSGGGGGGGSAGGAAALSTGLGVRSDISTSWSRSREEGVVGVAVRRDGEEPREAANEAACRSFLRRLSSAPRLEAIGRREEEGERLVGRLLCEPLATADERFLLREREEERREEYGGDRVRERAERLNGTRKNQSQV